MEEGKGRVMEAGIADEEDSSLNSNTSSSSSLSSQSDADDDVEPMKATRLPSRFTQDSGQIIEAADADEMDEGIVASSSATTAGPQAATTTTVLQKESSP